VTVGEQGYSLFGIRDKELDITQDNAKLLFQHHSKDYYYLVDRIVMVSPEWKVVFDAIGGVSKRWLKSVKGRIVGIMLRRYMMYLDNPQWYGNYGDYFFASTYSIIKSYLQRVIKVLINNYGLHNKYYKLQIPKHKLIKLSELFYTGMIPLCERLLPRYRKMIHSQQ